MDIRVFYIIILILVVVIILQHTYYLWRIRKPIDASHDRRDLQLIGSQINSIQKELGELSSLVSDVDSLKKILSNVKNRGILGEVQLKKILDDILAPSQYAENIPTVPGSDNRVEFAIRFPKENGREVYLPIDAKFPADAYGSYISAMEQGQREDIIKAGKDLDKAIKKAGKDISEKYVYPGYTTDFAIMFIPFEGLFLTVVERGLLEVLQREYKVVVAGPSTMAALLNSLYVGFQSIAISKKAAHTTQVLKQVSSEFGKFYSILEKHQQRLNQAASELDALVGVRTRAINKALGKLEDAEVKEEE